MTPLLRQILRRDLASFIAKSFELVSPAQPFLPNWHLEALAWRLDQCRRGKLRRLIVTLPPRQLKSISASVALPAFALGHDPTKRIICVSYSADLASKLARDCRAVMSSPWYNTLFPGTILSREKSAELDFMTTERGYRLATSVGGTLTGRGGNLIILDDPMKPDEALSEARRKTVCDWFDNTLDSRLDNKSDDVIIIVMQRLHIDDLIGYVLAKDDSWTILNLPAIADVEERIQIGPNRSRVRRIGELLHPEREPQSVIDDMRRTMGSFNFAAQYQQTPIPVEGELIRWAWFRFFEQAPVQGHDGYVVQSWDTASKAGELNGFSVCTTWLVKGHTYYLASIYRAKPLFPDLRRKVIELAEHWKPRAVLIEDKGSGTSLIQEFRDGALPYCGRPIPIEPEGDKISRAVAQSAIIEAGNVLLGQGRSWITDLRDEIVQFPNGRHDDQIDSISQFLKWAQRPKNAMIKMRIAGI